MPLWPASLCRGHPEQTFDERSARMSSSAGRLRHESFDERSAWRVHLACHLRTRLPVDSAPRVLLHALLHVEFHAILAHEDVDKIHDFPRIAGTSIAVNPENEVPPEKEIARAFSR